jgi:hypothetical protein
MSYTQGSVIFAGSGGVLTEDNANFYWDDSNDNVKLGPRVKIGDHVFSPRLSHFSNSGAGVALTDTASLPCAMFREAGGTVAQLSLNTHHFSDRSASYQGVSCHLDVRGTYGLWHVYRYTAAGAEYIPLYIGSDGHTAIGENCRGYYGENAWKPGLGVYPEDGVQNSVSLASHSEFVLNTDDRARLSLLNRSTSSRSSAIYWEGDDGSGYGTAAGLWEMGNDYAKNGGQTFYLADATIGACRCLVDASGNFGLNTDSPTCALDVNGDTLRLRAARTPASASAAGNAGDVCWDADYVYVCVATDSWKRVALGSW